MRGAIAVLMLFVLAACGRIEYGPLHAGGTDGAATDAVVDAGMDPILAMGSIAVGSHFACAIVADGALSCWGDNQYGAIGQPLSTEMAVLPVELTGVGTALEITAASGADVTADGYFACARRPGDVVCWGANGHGELADGTRTNNPMPVQIGGVGDAIQISAGGRHSCAVRSSGTVACWGFAEGGRLGADAPATPVVEVPGVADAVEVRAGGEHTCARLRTGEVACWGMNTHGELGDGTTVGRSTPAVVPGIADAIALATGQDHTCVVHATGAASCWGANETGQLGDGTATPSSVPREVIGLTDAIAIAGNHLHVCVIRAGGIVACWGEGDYGDLGDVALGDALAPRDVAGAPRSKAVACGEHSTCVRSVDEQIYCWGANGAGQVGSGEMADPAPVSRVAF